MASNTVGWTLDHDVALRVANTLRALCRNDQRMADVGIDVACPVPAKYKGQFDLVAWGKDYERLDEVRLYRVKTWADALFAHEDLCHCEAF